MMKQIYNLYRRILTLGDLCVLAMAVLFMACTDMNELHQRYLDRGEKTYAAAIDSIAPHPGRNRIQFDLIVTSQRIKTVRIYWNDYKDQKSDRVLFKDSADTDITGKGIFKKIVENLDERSYTFRLVSFDEFGNRSLPNEIHAYVYGDKYQALLVPRSKRSTEVDKDGNLRITWGVADGAYGSEVRYTNLAGEVVTKIFPIKQSVSVVEGIMGNTPYEFRTVYKPDTTGTDNFYTDYVKVTDHPFPFYKKDWNIIDFSSEHGGGDNTVKNFIDGTDATRWHSKAGASSYPHFATIDMGGVRTITQFSLWVTTFENPGGDFRSPKTFQLLVSLDNTSWTDLGEFTLEKKVGEQKYPTPANTQARYFKFIGLTPNTAGEKNMVMGEITAYGY